MFLVERHMLSQLPSHFSCDVSETLGFLSQLYNQHYGFKIYDYGTTVFHLLFDLLQLQILKEFFFIKRMLT